jgi:hypothetical protein
MRHRPVGRANPLQNRSTWMINIGTHKKPNDEEEFRVLRDSLLQAIGRMLDRPDFDTQCFYAVSGRGRDLVKHDALWERTRANLKISRIFAEYAIERGSRTGRIDAHIIISVKHNDSKIQIDHRRIGQLLDEELDRENDYFVMAQTRSTDPTKAGEFLKWAEPNLYTSYSALGHQNVADANVYIRKQNSDRVVYPEQENALNKMAIDFILSNDYGLRDPVTLMSHRPTI